MPEAWVRLTELNLLCSNNFMLCFEIRHIRTVSGNYPFYLAYLPFSCRSELFTAVQRKKSFGCCKAGAC